MKKHISSKLLNGFVIIGIIITIIALVVTPLVLTAFFKVSGFKSPSDIAFIITGCIYVCAIPYLISLFKLKSICKLLSSENPFTLKISENFKTIGVFAFLEVFIFIGVNLFLYFAYDIFLYALTIIPLFVIPFISITAGFLAIVMSNIFRKAAEIKEENDLTF